MSKEKRYRQRSWKEVTRLYNQKFHTRVCPSSIERTHRRLLKRIRARFMEDQVIRDWLEDHGVDMSESPSRSDSPSRSGFSQQVSESPSGN